MGVWDPSGATETPAQGIAPDYNHQDSRGRGGRLRRLLSGAPDDEFTEQIAPLTTAQREQLAHATDVLMKRYSISRTSEAIGSDEPVEREPVSADELGAVLHTVLAEAFDFEWFNRPDLPWAPELAYESSTDDRPVRGPVDDEAIRAQDPLSWSEREPGTHAFEVPERAEFWVPQVTEPVRTTSSDAGAGADSQGELEAAERDAAERVAAEMEHVLDQAVAAEREAILFAAAARERLQKAREALAAIDSDRNRLP